MKLPKMLMVGASTSNIGKTELVCTLIKQFCSTNKIIGLKVTTYYDNDIQYHGTEQILIKKNYDIVEETDYKSQKDTSRMLQAGAYKAFLIRVWNDFSEEAINQFLSQNIGNKNSLIICESNSMRKVVEPGVFLMIKNKNSQHTKPSAIETEKYVDKSIISDGKTFDFNFKRIKLINLQFKFV